MELLSVSLRLYMWSGYLRRIQIGVGRRTKDEEMDGHDSCAGPRLDRVVGLHRFSGYARAYNRSYCDGGSYIDSLVS